MVSEPGQILGASVDHSCLLVVISISFQRSHIMSPCACLSSVCDHENFTASASNHTELCVRDACTAVATASMLVDAVFRRGNSLSYRVVIFLVHSALYA